jgi:cysteine-rich repeat protein
LAGGAREDTVGDVPVAVLSFARVSLVALAAGALVPACLNWSELEQGRCGDGFVGPEEACDDGNRVSGDGCSDTCQIEPAVCGDGRVEGNEKCDDGNTNNAGACVNCMMDASCGDGFVQVGKEQCDDGMAKNGAPGDPCNADCTFAMTAPTPACGNGKLDPGEACDDGNMSDSDSCLTSCSWATCGDGRVRTGVEECDWGAPDAPPDCTHGCLVCGNTKDEYYRAGTAHCYDVHNEAVTEQQARSKCQMEGGDLWTVTSQLEGSDVISNFMLMGRYWLGLLTTKTGNSWVSGEGIKYTSFAPGEPSDPALHCVAIDAPTGVSASQSDAPWSSAPCTATLGYVCERAPPFISPTDHHAYRLHTGTVTADAARTICMNEDGHLATLETDAERVFVGKNVGVAAWVDANLVAPGQFVWSTGSPVDSTQFAAGQPDGVGTEQACLMFNAGDKYADAPCSELHAFICEFE